MIFCQQSFQQWGCWYASVHHHGWQPVVYVPSGTPEMLLAMKTLPSTISFMKPPLLFPVEGTCSVHQYPSSPALCLWHFVACPARESDCGSFGMAAILSAFLEPLP